MGHFARQADHHAEEMGRLSDIEDRVEHQWKNLRPELAAQLADGDTLHANGAPLLDFDDVIDRICLQSREGMRAALLLCLANQSLGGHQFTQLIEREALALVDDFEQTFKDALEKENG